MRCRNAVRDESTAGLDAAMNERLVPPRWKSGAPAAVTLSAIYLDFYYFHTIKY